MNDLLNATSHVNGDRPVNGRGLGHLKLTENELVRLAADIATGQRPFQPSLTQTSTLTGVPVAAIRAEIKARQAAFRRIGPAEVWDVPRTIQGSTKIVEMAQHVLDMHKAGRSKLDILRYVEHANGFRFEPKQGQTRRHLGADLIRSAKLVVSTCQADPPDPLPLPVITLDLIDTPQGRQNFLRQMAQLIRDRGVGQHHDAGHPPDAGQHNGGDPTLIPAHHKVLMPVIKVDLVDTPEGRRGYLRQVRLLFERLDAERGANGTAAE